MATANQFITYLEKNKYPRIIDSMHTKMCNELNIPIYWIEPPLVKQGSKNGMFESELSGRSKLTKFGDFKYWLTDTYHLFVSSNTSWKRISKFLNIK